MNNTFSVLTATTIKARTHIASSPLEQFISNLPFTISVIGFFIVTITIIKRSIEKDKIPEYFSEPDSISGKMLYNSLQQTKAYYKNNRIQMTVIFICAIISCFVGLTVLMISIFYFNDEAKTMGIISGTVVSFISGTFFWIYKQCNNQVQIYFNELMRIQNTFIAIELTQECNDETKNINVDKIINFLINAPNHPILNNTEQEK